jgi:hypothetical protein
LYTHPPKIYLLLSHSLATTKVADFTGNFKEDLEAEGGRVGGNFETEVAGPMR